MDIDIIGLPEHYSEEQVAKYLKIGLSTLRRLRMTGKLKSIKVGGHPRITKNQLLDYIASLEHEACRENQKP